MGVPEKGANDVIQEAAPPPDPPQMPSRVPLPSSKGLGILILCFFAAGLAVAGWGGFELKRAGESRRWPTTSGTVTQAYVLKEQQRQEDHVMFRYYPKVQYRYLALGQVYTADRIAFGGLTEESQHDAQKMVDQYPTGMVVTVYYDPNDPSVAVLKAGYRLPAYAMVASGMVLCAGGMLGFRMWRRKQARRNIYFGK